MMFVFSESFIPTSYAESEMSNRNREKHFYLKILGQYDINSSSTSSLSPNTNIGVGFESWWDLSPNWTLAGMYGYGKGASWIIFPSSSAPQGDVYLFKAMYFPDQAGFFYGAGYAKVKVPYANTSRDSDVWLVTLGYETGTFLFFNGLVELSPVYIQETTGNKWGIALSLGIGLF